MIFSVKHWNSGGAKTFSMPVFCLFFLPFNYSYEVAYIIVSKENLDIFPLTSAPGSNRFTEAWCCIMWCLGIHQKISCVGLDLAQWCILWVNTAANQKTDLPRVILSEREGIVSPCDPTGQWRAQKSNGLQAVTSRRRPVMPHLWKYPTKARSAVLQTSLL